jgi:hypothetical protein
MHAVSAQALYVLTLLLCLCVYVCDCLSVLPSLSPCLSLSASHTPSRCCSHVQVLDHPWMTKCDKAPTVNEIEDQVCVCVCVCVWTVILTILRVRDEDPRWTLCRSMCVPAWYGRLDR